MLKCSPLLLLGALIVSATAPTRAAAQDDYVSGECRLINPSIWAVPAESYTLCARLQVETVPIGPQRTQVTVSTRWDASSLAFWGFGNISYFYAYDGCAFFPYCLNEGGIWGGRGEWTTRVFEAEASFSADDITGFYADAYHYVDYGAGVRMLTQFGHSGPARRVIVPEPAAALLMGLALPLLAMIGRRARHRPTSAHTQPSCGTA